MDDIDVTSLPGRSTRRPGRSVKTGHKAKSADRRAAQTIRPRPSYASLVHVPGTRLQVAGGLEVLGVPGDVVGPGRHDVSSVTPQWGSPHTACMATRPCPASVTCCRCTAAFCST